MRTPRTNPGAAPPPRTAPPARGRRAHAGPPAEEDTAPRPGHGPRPAAPAPTPAPGAEGARQRPFIRPRTVRAKIVSLLMVPVVALIALWAVAALITAQDIAGQRQFQQSDTQVRIPVARTVAELQAERRAAVRYVTSPDDAHANALRAQAKRTDAAADALRLDDDHTVADGKDSPYAVVTRLSTFVSSAGRLTDLRTDVLDGAADWDRTFDQYTRTIDEAFGVTGALARIGDAQLGADARVLLELARAGEMLAREDALLSSAQLTHTFDAERLRTFAGTVQTRRDLTEAAVRDLPDAGRKAWQAKATRRAHDDVRAAEDKVIAAPTGRKAAQAVPAATWEPAQNAVRRAVSDIGAQAGLAAVAGPADPLARAALTPAGAAVVLGLAAVVASLLISVRIGRGLVVELAALRNSALDIARRRLPDAVHRLRAGEEIDIRTEVPHVQPQYDEIGQVAEALAAVHRAAVHAAVERAELVGGVSGIFVNLARRSQVLVHRQLNLLDTMERRADDPGELGDLFRLDHLTTRMRRHAESLIILSGAAPGRAWRMPVPLTNVVRAAVSEIEDYARVEVRRLPEVAVAGAAVADLTHLLAELVENAAQFSPPHTKVRISGEPVSNGYALEIEDRGLGMGKEALSAANRRIEQAEALDLFDSDRLGLFVVSRLATRHRIQVHLRTSPYGGTTAVVLLPIPLLQSAATKGAGAQTPAGADRQDAPAPVAEPASASGRDHGGAFDPGPRSAARAPRPALVAGLPPAGRAATPLRLHSSTSDTGAHGSGEGGLPRRVRQASLVPQLRETPEQPSTASPSPDDTAHRRTPEQVRDRMTAYRSGWVRGREGDDS